MSLVTGTTAVFGDTHPNPRGYLYPEAIRPHPQPTAGVGRAPCDSLFRTPSAHLGSGPHVWPDPSQGRLDVAQGGKQFILEGLTHPLGSLGEKLTLEGINHPHKVKMPPTVNVKPSS